LNVLRKAKCGRFNCLERADSATNKIAKSSDETELSVDNSNFSGTTVFYSVDEAYFSSEKSDYSVINARLRLITACIQVRNPGIPSITPASLSRKHFYLQINRFPH
jgi:hypothetical protein